ncbi:MAG TPA: choice-of-anchor B family protein [Vicinamibacteria bacterium]|nr:choice-of-anchor B family protein [Vicinamibacteria bacterium]
MLIQRASVLSLGILAWACGAEGPLSSAAPTASATPDPNARNMTLLAHLDLTALHNGVAHAQHDEPAVIGPNGAGSGNWGYTSPDGRRFALTGTSAGLSIVEVSDPRKPRAIGLVPGATSQWREVRTYGHYLYISTEAKTGLDIVDMADPDHPRKVQTWSKTFTSAHTVTVDTERGLLFANGANGRRGGMRVLDIGTDPEDPEEVGALYDFYVHDGHLRGTVYYASAIYDGFESLLDTSDPRRLREITRFFTGGRFTHNSWLTRDGRYLFTTDERSGRPLEGWDLLDPLAPRKVSEYLGRAGTIPHNVMVDGDRLLVAHYVEGVHLLDIRNPEQPVLLGSYDTYLGTEEGFHGAWGAYIFPGSDVIVVSDIEGGLYVVGYSGPGGGRFHR